jgi:YVTN family beta-propeller protein
MLAAGCGEDDADNAAGAGAAPSSSAGEGGAGQGGAGGGPGACTTTSKTAPRGAAVALSPDDSTLVVANRDSGTVTVLAVDYADARPKMTVKAEIEVGGEPWQVAIDGCGQNAYVVTRADQQLVEIVDLYGSPKKGRVVTVGSEPTAVALTPNNTLAYVANWVDGTLSVIDVAGMTAKPSVDLNGALAGTGLLGDSVSKTKYRAGLAHPRSIAITNDGDAEDGDEKIYVTEFYAQRTGPEGANGVDADNSKQGVLYAVDAAGAAKVIDLPPFADTGFNDHRGASGTPTGCFPNQLQSVTVNGKLAYVTAVCASPEGPIGVFQKGACTGDAQCNNVPGACIAGVGSCVGSCAADADCGFGSPAGTCDLAAGGACKPIATNVKTTTHPAVYVVDTTRDLELAGARANLAQRWTALYNEEGVANDASRRLPLFANDIAFVPDTGVAYVTANGTDAAFRIKYDPATAEIQEIGAGPGKAFIDLGGKLADAQKGKNPVGMVVGHDKKEFAFVSNDVGRNVSAIDLPKQIVAGSEAEVNDPRVVASTAQPEDAKGQAILRGKRFFNTGLGRWSLAGQGWGACQSCHGDGLTDNVTWYFARGPRQSTSLDGTFASKDPSDQRVLNWTGIFDELHDFEGNTRGVSGGVGAQVSANSAPPVNADRIDVASKALFPPDGAVALNGSGKKVTDDHSVLKDWNDIEAYVQTIRSPRGVTGLDAALVATGSELFADLSTGGRCQGCHSGAKWTISTRFYDPSGPTNAALSTTPWDGAALVAAGFPEALLPATAGNQFMRSNNGNAAAFDQIQCVLRNVGTFGIGSDDVGVAEVRADMVTAAQGNQAIGNGYNPPSLLGVQTGAPYLHAGQARTLEELFGPTFGPHWKALSQNVNFLASPNDVDALVAYLLSVDETTAALEVPQAGAEGGDFCAAP